MILRIIDISNSNLWHQHCVPAFSISRQFLMVARFRFPHTS